MSVESLAVYTTVYPSVKPYLADWYKSVQEQTDNEFDLYIGIDSLTPEEIATAIGEFPRAVLLHNPIGASFAQIRNAALERLADEYDAIVLVDSDDLLLPSRVESARAALKNYDVTGCALRLIDEQGRDLGFTFGQAWSDDYSSLLARYNIFGLSNTAYSAPTLRRCLPIPDDCVLIDWLLATRACATGANLNFDPVARMSYRQYRNNTARVLPPFTAQYIKRAAALVVDHYRLLFATSKLQELVGNSKMLATAFDRAKCFHQAISAEEDRLEQYVKALNKLTPKYVWWWCIAHPQLEDIWKN